MFSVALPMYTWHCQRLPATVFGTAPRTRNLSRPHTEFGSSSFKFRPCLHRTDGFISTISTPPPPSHSNLLRPIMFSLPLHLLKFSAGILVQPSQRPACIPFYNNCCITLYCRSRELGPGGIPECSGSTWEIPPFCVPVSTYLL
jgi:hypothetical protein